MLSRVTIASPAAWTQAPVFLYHTSPLSCKPEAQVSEFLLLVDAFEKLRRVVFLPRIILISPKGKNTAHDDTAYVKFHEVQG